MGERGFVVVPHQAEWIELDLDRWLDFIQGRLGDGYEPDSASRCFEPKPRWMLRPGTVLTLEDEVVYNYVIGEFLQGVWRVIGWAQGDPDLAYRLSEDRLGAVKWVTRGVRAHKEFRRLSLDKLSQDITHAVTTDVTGFYENIDIDRLLSDLRVFEPDGEHLELLQKCLRRWSIPRGKGIPQGYTASDILAKVYFNPVDQALRNDGIVHLRYVDDLRVFCRSRRDAKIVIRRLTDLMSRRGLNLQSAKTEIHTKAEAERRFIGFGAMLEDVERQLAAELEVQGDEDEGDYGTTSRSFRELQRRRGAPPEILERTFRDLFPLADQGEFDKSFFHFLLGRLAAVQSTVAVEYCLAALAQRPEETRYTLDYLAAVPLEPRHVDSIVRYLESDDAIYDYQLYQILSWFLVREDPHPAILALARRWAYDHNHDMWLRIQCLNYLGAFGDQADLEQIEAAYAGLNTDVERATCVEALRRLERGRRNGFYGRVAGDSALVRRAVQRVRSTD